MEPGCKRTVIGGLLVVAPALMLTACGDHGPTLTIPDGTPVTVTLYATTRSDRVDPGQTLLARVDEAVKVDEAVALRRGDLVTLEVLQARAAAEDRPALLRLGLSTFEFPHGRTEVEASEVEFVGPAPGTDGAGSPTPESRATQDGDHGALPVEGRAIVLLAGQPMRFVIRDPIEVAINP